MGLLEGALNPLLVLKSKDQRLSLPQGSLVQPPLPHPTHPGPDSLSKPLAALVRRPPAAGLGVSPSFTGAWSRLRAQGWSPQSKPADMEREGSVGQFSPEGSREQCLYGDADMMVCSPDSNVSSPRSCIIFS